MTKAGMIAISGRPNVGKSTIINGLLGEKIAITSNRPETTRDNIRGILSLDDCQMIFTDTPGIHKPHDLLGKIMLSRAQSTLMESDIVLMVTEKHLALGEDDRNIMERLPFPKNGKKVILIINKVDKVRDKRLLLPLMEKASKMYDFDEILPLCALKKDDIRKLLGVVRSYLSESPFLYPEDQLTDKTERFMVGEIIREKVLANTYEEVPHSVAVTVDEMSDRDDDGKLKIYATIFVERTSQRSIIIGKNGEMIRRISQASRKEIQKLLEEKICLDLWVKVREKWKRNPSSLRDMGYVD